MILPYTDSDRTLIAELGLYGRVHEISERLFLHRQHGDSSCKANPISTGWHARVGWFDPTLQGKVYFSRWRQIKEYLIAIRRAPITIGEKSACVFWMVVYFRGRAKHLFRELVMGLRLRWLRIGSKSGAEQSPIASQQPTA
jgi:hypothetical protein